MASLLDLPLIVQLDILDRASQSYRGIVRSERLLRYTLTCKSWHTLVKERQDWPGLELSVIAEDKDCGLLQEAASQNFLRCFDHRWEGLMSLRLSLKPSRGVSSGGLAVTAKQLLQSKATTSQLRSFSLSASEPADAGTAEDVMVQGFLKHAGHLRCVKFEDLGAIQVGYYLKLLPAASLETFTLCNSRLCRQDLVQLGCKVRLKHLEVSPSWSKRKFCLADLQPLGALKNLETLKVDRAELEKLPSWIAGLAKLKKLCLGHLIASEEGEMAGYAVDFSGLKSVCSVSLAFGSALPKNISSLQNLKSISFSLTGKTPCSLSELELCGEKLKELTIWGTTIVTPVPVGCIEIQGLAKIPALKSFRFCGLISSEQVKILIEEGLSSIKKFNISAGRGEVLLMGDREALDQLWSGLDQFSIGYIETASMSGLMRVGIEDMLSAAERHGVDLRSLREERLTPSTLGSEKRVRYRYWKND